MNNALHFLAGALMAFGITYLILARTKSTSTSYNRTGGTVTENGKTRAMTDEEMKKVDDAFKLADEAFAKASEAFNKLP